MADVPRQPIYIKYWPPPWPQAQSYSVSLTLLSPPEQPPFKQTDWPLPRPPYRVYAEARSAYLPLLHSVQPPTRLDQWPVPVQLGRVYAPSTGVPLPLRIPAQAFVQSDWPTPKRPPLVYALTTRASIQLLHSIQPPIAQRDWPVPIRPAIVRAESYGMPATLRAPVVVADRPSVQTDWPSPKGAQFLAQQIHTNLALGVPGEKPFAQTSWPLPVQPPRVYAQSQRPPLALTGAKPFLQSDWPLPKQVIQPTSARTWIQRSILIAAPKPFAQPHWPVPYRPPFRSSPGFVSGSNLALGIPTVVVAGGERVYLTILG